MAEAPFRFGDRDLRLIVRRQRFAAGDQLTFDDADGWRLHVIPYQRGTLFATAALVEHHRLRGGAPEEAIRQLKEDFELNHAPQKRAASANWLWWHASALACNVGRWVRVLALPEAFRTCRDKLLCPTFFNVAARVVRSGRRLHLRLPRAYAHAGAFVEALARLRRLPVFV